MSILNDKYKNIKYTSLGSLLKKELDEIEDLVYDSTIAQEGFLRKETHDKDGNNIIDVAETLNGLTAKIEELNMLVGATSNIQEQIDQIKKKKPKMIKTVHTIEGEPGQTDFIFGRSIQNEAIVEVRINSTWLHDEDYIVVDNKIVLRNPLVAAKSIDFIFYECILV